MFGTYRVLLALIVVWVHFEGSTWMPGHYAVFGFFMLSGYLMTLIMDRTYGYSARGIGLYGINRLLRIYPMYWLSCGIAVLILLLPGVNAMATGSPYQIPANPLDWAKNIGLMVGHFTRPVLIQPAWTLTVEVIYYLLIGLGLSRTRRSTLIWLLASIGLTLYMVVSNAPFVSRFFTVWAASLPFAIGACLYHWKAEVSQRLSWFVEHPLAPALAFGLFMVNGLVANALGMYEGIFFYLSIPLCALIVVSLYQRRELKGFSRGFDRLMGDLSYPIYLIHAPLAWLLLYLCRVLELPITEPSLAAFIWFTPPTILLSWLMSVFLEARVEQVRARVKTRL